jgi:DNA-directed RNA polymerase specialized sigma24 family protein
MKAKNPNIETRIANRAKSIFAAFGQVINDFYLEAGIYFVGGFNAALVAWDIYTSLTANAQPLPYAIILATIAFIAVEGLAVYLVGAAAKTNNRLLWFFSVVFATFFTYAHYQEANHSGVIAQYITLAIPFFVVVGYWARTVKVDIETGQAQIVRQREKETARLRELEDEERQRQYEIKAQKLDHKLEMDRLKLEQEQAQKMAQIEVHLQQVDGSFATNDTKMNPKMNLLDLANDTRRLKKEDRLNRIKDLIEGHTQSEIADILNVSLSTIKRDIRELNGNLRKVK